MKNIGIFYLIFTLLLSALPCSDELNELDFSENTTLNIGNDIQQGELEACFAICTCNCCGQHIVEIQVANPNVKPSEKSLAKQISNYQSLLQQQDSSIWHPPKVC